jgi:hypothetical protein
MQQFHQFTASSYKDEDIAIPDIAVHSLVNHPTERTDTLAHVRASGTEIVAHRIIKAEHQA